MRGRFSFIVAGFIASVISPPVTARAQEPRVTLKSTAPFARVAEALERAVTEEKMGLVCHANAQHAAAGRGVTIKGNQVLMVFRNDFAVRLLAADPDRRLRGPDPYLRLRERRRHRHRILPSAERGPHALSAPRGPGRGQRARRHFQGDRRARRGRTLIGDHPDQHAVVRGAYKRSDTELSQSEADVSDPLVADDHRSSVPAGNTQVTRPPSRSLTTGVGIVRR